MSGRFPNEVNCPVLERERAIVRLDNSIEDVIEIDVRREDGSLDHLAASPTTSGTWCLRNGDTGEVWGVFPCLLDVMMQALDPIAPENPDEEATRPGPWGRR